MYICSVDVLTETSPVMLQLTSYITMLKKFRDKSDAAKTIRLFIQSNTDSLRNRCANVFSTGTSKHTKTLFLRWRLTLSTNSILLHQSIQIDASVQVALVGKIENVET